MVVPPPKYTCILCLLHTFFRLSPYVLEFNKVNIFFRPEEAMFVTGKSLSSTEKYFCF